MMMMSTVKLEIITSNVITLFFRVKKKKVQTQKTQKKLVPKIGRKRITQIKGIGTTSKGKVKRGYIENKSGGMRKRVFWRLRMT